MMAPGQGAVLALRACLASCPHGRTFSTAAASVTDQMIQYALQQSKARQHDQAVDVLKSGLSMQPGGKGVEAARLLVAQGTVEADRGSWTAALDCSDQALDALAGVGAAEAGDPLFVRLAAGRLAVSTHLIQGHDEPAVSVCRNLTAAITTHAATSPVTQAARLASLGLELATYHALGRTAAAEAAAGSLAGDLVVPAQAEVPPGQHVPPTWAHEAALLALADWRASISGPGSGAGPLSPEHLYQRAADSATAHPPPPTSEVNLLHRELGAAAALGSAELAVRAEEWERAEELLGKALTAAEGVSFDKHPRVAPALLLLGWVYSRSARVTFAEGMYRQVATILKVDVNKDVVSLPSTAHASLVALLGWRFHQLLTALPNRGRESAAWEKLAHTAWAASGPVATGSTLEGVMGSAAQLTGQGAPGRGVLLSLPFRRALPLAVT